MVLSRAGSRARIPALSDTSQTVAEEAQEEHLFLMVGPKAYSHSSSGRGDLSSSREVEAPDAAADLLPLAYDELRSLARDLLRRHRAGGPQATSIVHEAYARVARGQSSPFLDVGQFLRTAARAMRFVIVDRLRREYAQKRGGGAMRCEIDSRIAARTMHGADLLVVDETLTRLAGVDPKKAALVELRFFGGLTFEEAATALGVSLATVKRDWALARAWLYRELSGS